MQLVVVVEVGVVVEVDVDVDVELIENFGCVEFYLPWISKIIKQLHLKKKHQ